MTEKETAEALWTAMGKPEWKLQLIAAAIATMLRESALAAAQQETARLRAVLEGMAEGDCMYGDGCPIFGSRHYRCMPCVARAALEPSAPAAAEAPATPGEVQEPRGTAACPICAWDKPHYHTQKEIADRPNIEGARAAFEKKP